MTRKAVLLTMAFAMLAFPLVSRAQTQQPNIGSFIELVRSDMQADRTKIISAAMDFSDKDGAAFWPIYRAYQYERSTLDDRRAAVIKEYAANHSNLTDAEAKAMAERMFNCEAELVALKKKYYKRFNAALPALTVTKFFQLEHRIDLLVDMKVESSLPPLFGDSQLQLQADPQQQVDPQVN